LGILQAKSTLRDSERSLCNLRQKDSLSYLDENAAINLLRVDPTTIAGVVALLEYFAEVEAIDDGGLWPDSISDDDDPAVKRSATFGYFVVRDATRALRRVIAAQA
jgi:hypothetical protein